MIINNMKTIYQICKAIVLALTVTSLTGCNDLLTTDSSTAVSDVEVVNKVANLNMVLTSAYRRLYFNFNTEVDNRVYAGLAGLQMYVDLSGADILCHTNMGGTQLITYTFDNDKTQYTSPTEPGIWLLMYKTINQVNDVLDHIDEATGDESEKDYIKGQALAIRGLCYFHLIQNFQQTYIIAKDKPGVILRTSTNDPDDLPRSSVSECYNQILSDLTSAKDLLKNFERPNLWTIDQAVVSGILARVYLVVNDWNNALNEASSVYNKYGQLMTRDQYRSGFNKVISNNYPEIVWAMQYTNTDNIGGSTQFNFWFNQDPSYGEGYMDGPIYSFLAFFADGEFEKLFEKTEDRYQFWKRTNNASPEVYNKWAYDKYKDYGDKNGAVQGNTYPEVSLMRGSEMLLIMAEASAHLNNGNALTYLNTLQRARGVINLTNVTGNDLLEAIYVERRKELLGEGVTGMYDLLRLQKPLIRRCETSTYLEGHYTWGVYNLNGYDATSANPIGTLPSNDYRFICQIPQMEMANNNALTNADQNPFSGQ